MAGSIGRVARVPGIPGTYWPTDNRRPNDGRTDWRTDAGRTCARGACSRWPTRAFRNGLDRDGPIPCAGLRWQLGCRRFRPITAWPRRQLGSRRRWPITARSRRRPLRPTGLEPIRHRGPLPGPGADLILEFAAIDAGACPRAWSRRSRAGRRTADRRATGRRRPGTGGWTTDRGSAWRHRSRAGRRPADRWFTAR